MDQSALLDIPKDSRLTLEQMPMAAPSLELHGRVSAHRMTTRFPPC